MAEMRGGKTFWSKIRGGRNDGRGSSPSASGEEGTRAQVVLVSDDAGGADLCAYLRKQSVRVERAASLKEALTMAKAGRPLLLVVDEALLQKPFDGSPFDPGLRITLVLLGTRSAGDGWRKAEEMGADAYLTKSLSTAERAALLRAILRRL